MTAHVSSRLRLLLDSVPLNRVDSSVLAASEDQVLAWQMDVGQELAAENVPIGYVALVVEGSLRISGRDALGEPFTLRRIHTGEWWGLWSSLTNGAAATCRTTEPTKLLAVPISVFHGWCEQSDPLIGWLEAHPQREDLYAALRPLLAERARQDRTFLDVIDALQSSLRSVSLSNPADIEALDQGEHGISWLIPSLGQLLPDHDPFGPEGLSLSSLQRALESSDYGLRLVGYPTSLLQELLDSFDAATSVQQLSDDDESVPSSSDPTVLVEELPAWQNPDGEALLAAALKEELGRPLKDREGLVVKPIFGQSGMEQGLALLQMVCETLRLPFRRDVVDRMLKGMVGNKHVPSLENIGQIADGLGLNAVLMNLPSPHLGRLSMPAVLELPLGTGLVLVTGQRPSGLRVIDPQEGERWLDLSSLSNSNQHVVPSPSVVVRRRRQNAST